MLALYASKRSTSVLQKQSTLVHAGHAGTIPSVLHSRRWKKLAVQPPRPLPKFDLEDIQLKKGNTVTLHNPLIEIEIRKKKEIEKQMRIEAEEFEKYIPPVRGMYPLALADDFNLIWTKFIADHDGIKKTFTRRYFGLYEWDGPITLKKSFGDVNIFKVFRPQEYRATKAPFIYRNEFNFNKPVYTGEQLLDILDLYVRVLHTSSEESRRPIYSHFYIIIKAIRMRPAIHQKLVGSVRYQKLVMLYFLIAKQPNLALYVAIHLVPKCQPDTLDRWSIARLLDLPMVFDGNKEAITRLSNLEGSTQELGFVYEREYKLNLLSESIFEYYCSKPSMDITDAELLWLIRCAESRMQLKELMDLLPLVIKRLLKTSGEISSLDKVQLFYEPDLLNSLSPYERIVARYAIAFVQLGNKEMAYKFLLTVHRMPRRSMLLYNGDVGDMASALAGLIQFFPNDSSVLVRMLGYFACSKYEREMPGKSSRTDFLAQLCDDMVRYTISGQPDLGIYLVSIYHRICAYIPYIRGFSVLKRIYDHDPSLAIQWYSSAHGSVMDKDNQMIEWFVIQLRKDRKTFMDHLGAAIKRMPINSSQFVFSMCYMMYDYEADRRYLLARAFVDINESKNAVAMGNIIRSASHMPRKLLRPTNGLYSVLQRGHTTAQLIRNINIDSENLKGIIAGLVKACVNLNAVQSNSIIWREILRHGIEPGNELVRFLTFLRLNARLDLEDTLEMVKYIIGTIKLTWSPAHIEDSQIDQVTQGLIERVREADTDMEQNLEQDIEQDMPEGLHLWLPQTLGRDKSITYSFEIRAYVSLMDSLSRAGLYALVEPMAIYIMASSDLLRTKSLGVVSAVWLDSVGFNPNATSIDVQEAWRILKCYSNDLTKRYKDTNVRREASLNLNNYHSVIEAYIRKGDFDMAWHMIHVEMREDGMFPNVNTLCTLLSPIAVSQNLWSLGKQIVIKCNTHYPGVVKNLLDSPDVSHITKALVRSALV
ncbi:hypothetical protein IWW45_003744 [Coemansia sp. RSA 485]|nr:hypothetical protein IWW45_003744 [Coemansia sp. RSA 485]